MTTEPLLSAVEVAQRLAVSKRAVLKWATQGCPHQQGKVAGRECRLFALAQVKQWLRETGRDVPAEPVLGETVARAALGGVALDWDSMSTRLGALLQAMLDKQPSTPGDFAAMQRLATAIKNTLTELRALEEADLRRQDRAGKYVERSKAAAIMADAARMFAADLDTLAADMPRAIAQALERPDLQREDPMAVTRVLTQTVRHAVDEIRERRAGAIVRAVEAIGQAAREAAA